MHSKKEFIDDIAMTLGGYVTEQMVFEDLTTGPSNDLQVATALARDMVTKYGIKLRDLFSVFSCRQNSTFIHQ